MSKFMWQMAGVLAELERPLRQERTKAEREAAKRRGVKSMLKEWSKHA
jgi:DNA invertase Pin-like site-specific DNA recombinase